MKILHLAQERDAAVVAARILHGIAQDVTVARADTPVVALQWLHANRDAAAVVIEGEALRCASFVEEVRGLGLTTPVVVVAGSTRLEPALLALKSRADGYVVAGPTLEAALPRAVAAAIANERGRRQLVSQTLAGLGDEHRWDANQPAGLEDARRQKTEEWTACELAAVAARLADVEARHAAALARETRICTALQQRLFELESALRKGDERRASEAVASADQLAKRHAEFTANLAQAAQSRDALAAELSLATAALEEAREARNADVAAAAEQLRRREEELRADLATAVAIRTAVEHALAESDAAHQETRQRAASDLAAANERQAALEDLLTQETDRRATVERKLTAAEAAHQDAEQRHAAELAALQARYDAALMENAAARDELERQKAEASAVLERIARQHGAEMTAAAAQLANTRADLGAQLTDVSAAKTTTERALNEAQTALQRSAEELTATAMREAILEDRLAGETNRSMSLERQLFAADSAVQRGARDAAFAATLRAALEARLAHETSRAIHAERQLSASENARQDAERTHASELAAATTQLAALQATYDTAVTDHAAAYADVEQRLAGAMASHEQAESHAAAALASAATREAALIEDLAKESDARAALERDLSAVRTESARKRKRTFSILSTHRRQAREAKERFEAQLEHLHRQFEDEQQAHTRAASGLQQVSAECTHIRGSFDQLRSAFQTLEQVAGEHAAERARLETVVADRDSLLSVQAERHRLAQQDAADALARLQDKLREALDTGSAEMTRLQREIDGLRRELDSTRTHAEALRGVAERVPDLQTQLERSRNEQRRQFERAPHALCLCSPAGAIVDANHSFVALLGCRRVDELRNSDFVSAALDSAGDLGWLLDRARTTRRTETVESQWKTRDGRRLVVRLQALATATGSIEIVAEDISGVRALEGRLRQAQRMEAVGRLASEVAVTCEALLDDVARGAHEWLDRLGDDDAVRHGERLLTDVTRAAGFLRQLGTYGNEQLRALEPVSAQRVLRDLAPVLKRVVGDQIELVLPKSGGSFDVDVEAERLERVLINVAGYARERMPSGGEVRIDLSTKAVGRRFAARYSNVRPGEHVLITVTEQPSADAFPGDRRRTARSFDKPGVDLGVLVDLIASCGGHLWLEAQPAGNMVVKIHLPKPAGDAATQQRGGRLSRLFRSPSAANVRA